jgi:hypothetical protein
MRTVMTTYSEFTTLSHHASQALSHHASRHGGSVVACLTVVLQSRVRIRCLPSPQLTANLLVGCHLGWHLAEG